ncbi:MAG: LysM peptidoglycan-binding domain-containing protein [Anaerolineaceae bacterium]|nr:LysM peptidoglycan-binding domain-containing protein [Anaerolineaceae bacterium]
MISMSACAPEARNEFVFSSPVPAAELTEVAILQNVTPQPTRPAYLPGTLVDYIAQSGDTLPALAVHFNTSESEIRAANPIIPSDVTTLPPGFPMQIPIYYESIWSSSFQIVPDIAFVYGPRDVDFDIITFVNSQPGWLKNVRDTVGEKTRSGAEVILYVSQLFSVSQKLILAILEYQTGALSDPEIPEEIDGYLLSYQDPLHKGFAQQIVWLANYLNNYYYRWREGTITTYKHSDGRLERPDPWQNAATVSLQYYYSQIMDRDRYNLAISEMGLLETYSQYFSDPWQGDLTLIPGSFHQPEFIFPFAPGQTWAYTGGPHTAWGIGEPFSAVDFAPASAVGGCSPSEYYALAIADGVIVRTGPAYLVLDLDGDGDEKTGWNIFYLHLANQSFPKTGSQLKQGDPIGLPSCEGGTSTGTHVHIARKYNGEWILAGGPLAFEFEGWKVGFGTSAYAGTLEKNGIVLKACVCSDKSSQITAKGLIK